MAADPHAALLAQLRGVYGNAAPAPNAANVTELQASRAIVTGMFANNRDSMHAMRQGRTWALHDIFALFSRYHVTLAECGAALPQHKHTDEEARTRVKKANFTYATFGMCVRLLLKFSGLADSQPQDIGLGNIDQMQPADTNMMAQYIRYVLMRRLLGRVQAGANNASQEQVRDARANKDRFINACRLALQNGRWPKYTFDVEQKNGQNVLLCVKAIMQLKFRRMELERTGDDPAAVVAELLIVQQCADSNFLPAEAVAALGVGTGGGDIRESYGEGFVDRLLEGLICLWIFSNADPDVAYEFLDSQFINEGNATYGSFKAFVTDAQLVEPACILVWSSMVVEKRRLNDYAMNLGLKNAAKRIMHLCCLNTEATVVPGRDAKISMLDHMHADQSIGNVYNQNLAIIMFRKKGMTMADKCVKYALGNFNNDMMTFTCEGDMWSRLVQMEDELKNRNVWFRRAVLGACNDDLANLRPDRFLAIVSAPNYMNQTLTQIENSIRGNGQQASVFSNASLAPANMDDLTCGLIQAVHTNSRVTPVGLEDPVNQDPTQAQLLNQRDCIPTGDNRWAANRATSTDNHLSRFWSYGNPPVNTLCGARLAAPGQNDKRNIPYYWDGERQTQESVTWKGKDKDKFILLHAKAVNGKIVFEKPASARVQKAELLNDYMKEVQQKIVKGPNVSQGEVESEIFRTLVKRKKRRDAGETDVEHVELFGGENPDDEGEASWMSKDTVDAATAAGIQFTNKKGEQETLVPSYTEKFKNGIRRLTTSESVNLFSDMLYVCERKTGELVDAADMSKNTYIKFSSTAYSGMNAVEPGVYTVAEGGEYAVDSDLTYSGPLTKESWNLGKSIRAKLFGMYHYNKKSSDKEAPEGMTDELLEEKEKMGKLEEYMKTQQQQIAQLNNLFLQAKVPGKTTVPIAGPAFMNQADAMEDAEAEEKKGRALVAKARKGKINPMSMNAMQRSNLDKYEEAIDERQVVDVNDIPVIDRPEKIEYKGNVTLDFNAGTVNTERGAPQLGDGGRPDEYIFRMNRYYRFDSKMGIYYNGDLAPLPSPLVRINKSSPYYGNGKWYNVSLGATGTSLGRMYVP